MKYLITTLLAVQLLVVNSTPASAQVSGLKSRVPTDANAVVIIDTDKLFGSPLAERERWEARRKAAFDAGVTFISPNTTGVVIASKLDLEFGNTIWELVQVRQSSPANVPKIAARFGGEVDTIANRQSVRLPNDAIVVQVTPQVYASYMPANRQEVARWLNGTDKREVNDTFSSYIEQAFAYVEKVGTPIILALDLHGAFSEADVAARIKGSAIDQLEAAEKANVVSTLASIQGTMLGITIGDSVNASIRVDFGQAAEPLKPYAKQMILNVLEKQGASIPEIADWQEKVSGNTVLLQGKLTESGLKRVLSVLQLPPSLGRAMDDAVDSGESDSPESLMRISSQQYFNSVNDILKDIQDTRRDAKTVTAGGVAMWYKKYARKIDNLPLLNVDAELLDWGRDISTLLREGESALKSVGMRSAVRTGQNNTTGYQSYYGYDNGYYNGGYGGYGYRAGYGATNSNFNAATMANREKGRTDALIRNEERVAGAAQVQQMWQIIDAKTAEIRRSMTEKYNVEF